ncbi:9563_t:CDS:1, partial [Acaulospora colombiana]
IFQTNFDDDSDCTEWERLAAEFAKLTGSKANRPTYKSSVPSLKEAWESYESRWSRLSAPHPAGSLATATPLRLGFRDIPWPVLHQPTRAADLELHLTEGHISSFILSTSHPTSGQQSSLASSPNLDSRTRRLRIREALLRWHPDKIARILASIQSDDERSAVKDGAEIVARHLNALLARDS